MINLIVDLENSQQTWEQFKDKPNSIAIDGYVYGASRFNPLAPSANFNHHEEVDRLSTRATCAQMLLAIRTGFLDAFSNNGKIEANVYTNDCDQDVCMTWFVIKNYWLTKDVNNPLLNKLIYIEDLLDTFAGSYPFDVEAPVLKEVAWIFKPYTQFRISGGLDKKNPQDYESIIDDVGNRISRYIVGKGESIELETEYELIQKGKNFSMVRGIGTDFKMKLMSDGIKAYISFRERYDGNFSYTIGKMSPFISFDIQTILNKLNEIENSDDKWGGANTIAGSPRIKGSKINPDKMFKIINEI